MNATLACEQALRDALAAGREKERELATTSLYFEYLHRKRRCEILIGGDDISYDVITPWHVFFNICLHSRSFPLLADWRKSDSSVNREQQGYWRWNSNSRDVAASSPPFPTTSPERPGELARRLTQHCQMLHAMLRPFAHPVACCGVLLGVFNAKLGADQTFRNNVGSFCLRSHVALRAG